MTSLCWIWSGALLLKSAYSKLELPTLHVNQFAHGQKVLGILIQGSLRLKCTETDFPMLFWNIDVAGVSLQI